jgi:hypothetical protein
MIGVLKDINLIVLINIPIFLSMIAIIIWGLLAEKIFGGSVPQIYNYLVISFACIVSSISGFMQIVRQETPGPFGKVIRGKYAVFSGILWMGFCLVLCIILLVAAYTNR